MFRKIVKKLNESYYVVLTSSTCFSDTYNSLTPLSNPLMATMAQHH